MADHKSLSPLPWRELWMWCSCELNASFCLTFTRFWFLKSPSTHSRLRHIFVCLEYKLGSRPRKGRYQKGVGPVWITEFIWASLTESYSETGSCFIWYFSDFHSSLIGIEVYMRKKRMIKKENKKIKENKRNKKKRMFRVKTPIFLST